MKDKFTIYIDGDKTIVVKGGDIVTVPLPTGRHEVSLSQSQQRAHEGIQEEDLGG